MINKILEFIIDNSPIRGGFKGNFVTLNLLFLGCVIFGFFLGYLFRKKNRYLSSLSNILLIVIIFAFWCYMGYKIIFYYKIFAIIYVISIFYIGNFMSFLIFSKNLKKNKNNFILKKLSRKSEFLFVVLIMWIVLINLHFLRGNLNLVQGADTWFHLSGFNKIDGILEFRNPAFKEGFNQYGPLSYLFVYILSVVTGISRNPIFNISAIFVNCFYVTVSYIFYKKITKNTYASIISCIYIFYFAAEFGPREFGLPLQVMAILCFLNYIEKDKKKYLGLFSIFFIALIFIHYELTIHLLVILIFYFLLKFLSKITRMKNGYHFVLGRLNKINLNLSASLIVILSLTILIFLLNLNREAVTIVPEIPLKLSNILSILSILLLPYVFVYTDLNKKSKLFLLSILLLSSNTLFYYLGLFKFHHVVFSTIAFNLITLPFSTLLVIEKTKAKKYELLMFISLLIITPLLFNYSYYGWYTPDSNILLEKRFNDVSDLLKEENIEDKVILIHPKDHLNRFLIVKHNCYIYSTNVLESGFKPLTAIGKKLEDYGFVDAVTRNKIANEFITNGDTEKLLSYKYKVDYILITKETFNSFNVRNKEFILNNYATRKNDKYILIKISE